MADNYRVLTRTYRPQTFDDIVSQEHVSSTLKNAIKQNRISHAYMFCGPRGVGKTTMARVLARTLNEIDASVDGESLSQTLNVVEIDAASNNKVEDVHHLREVVRVPPQSGKYKVFIIDEVHMLSKSAFNALLKTLEEPPPHAIFIFATTEPHKVLPTILSRVQRFDFKRISVDEIVEQLRNVCKNEGITIDDESLHVIAKKADGALRDALGLMDQAIAFCGNEITYSQITQALNIVGNDELFEFTDAVSKQNAEQGLLLIDQLLKDGVDILEFLVSLTSHFRNLYVAHQNEQMHLVEATAETKRRYQETAQLFSEDDLLRMLHMVSDAQTKIRDVQQPRVHFEILMLKLVHMSRIKNLKTLLDEAAQLKKKGSNRVAAKNSAQKEKSGEKPSLNGHLKEENPDKGPSRPNQQMSEEIEPKEEGTNESKEVSTLEDKSPVEAAQTEVTEEEDEDLDELLMGKPSLGFAKGISTANGVKKKKSVQKKEVQKRALRGVEDVEECWDEYLELLKSEVQYLLFEQMNRVRLKDLKGSEVIVSASDEFSRKLIHENQQTLTALFKEQNGVFVRFKCVVERAKKKKSQQLNPYERFRELQKKDPQLRSIVEIFGAEFEY
ncbi:DNA polymerase III subunit gamma/tau [Rhodohalobacter sulfatireducens]|uniref:DNA polymerase III subunit gamma/tau n=1 Tax=Rhodohalobacter sulfatireducens TaxID=2911366 RepID=A0ABS9K9V6_9BACT|nr:DNA polymerase III subunit gamma/tau [Rhodohalobacter sulfatireducens]MCG2587631.1 DNA polymerase III subunit gamma/tau [Rhodohalobacter sulfatireducens]